MKKPQMRRKRSLQGVIGRLSYTQAKAQYASLSSKKGLQGYNKALKLAGSRITAGTVKTMLKHRMEKTKRK